MAAAAPPKKQAPWKGFVAGSSGAMLSGAVTHPIDLVKVRMQLHGMGRLLPGCNS
jgi:solute carrier family 25 oxoglutarate transporter 11